MSNVLVVADYGQLCDRCGAELPQPDVRRKTPRKRRPGLKHRYCSRACAGKARRKQFVMTNNAGKAYVYVSLPEHPRANKGGNVPVHTLVAERKVGRFLRPYEVAHHLDGDGLNNDPENLLVVPASVNRWLPPLNLN